MTVNQDAYNDPGVLTAYENWRQANIIAMDAHYFRPNHEDNDQLWEIEEQALDNYVTIFNAYVETHQMVTQ